jgi:hypothetical protein
MSLKASFFLISKTKFEEYCQLFIASWGSLGKTLFFLLEDVFNR